MTTVEAIMAPHASDYKAVVREQQKAIARNSASQPRRVATYAKYIEGDRLMLNVRIAPDNPLLCKPLIRELCAWRRWARSERGKGFASPLAKETSTILLYAELYRSKRLHLIPQQMQAAE